MDHLLKFEDLSLSTANLVKHVVNSVSLELGRGERLGIVGESGSGKSLMMRAVLDLLPSGIVRSAGRVCYGGRDVAALPLQQLRQLRGGEIGLVFQEPMTSLNPALRIGSQMEEGLKLHTGLSADERRSAMLSMLERVGIAHGEKALSAYPHEFSGGMRQRIMLASVMLTKPKLLIADEPTTALDVVVQREVLDMMDALVRENGTSLVLISHDMAMVAQYTDTIMVMEKGICVERGRTEALLSAPRHPYTRKLLAALPLRRPARALSRSAPLVAVSDVTLDYGSGRKSKQVLHGVDLQIQPGEVVALVGGSGSGKSTLGRAIAGLLPWKTGSLSFRGRELRREGKADSDYRANCQMIFQDPYSSLDPRMSVFDIVAEPLRHEKAMSKADRGVRVAEILRDVGLGAEFEPRLPHQLSGGQRQRVAIARSLVRRPDFVIADEAVSALDMTVKAQVLELLARLQRENGFACLFISHDLGVVEQIADRVVVMEQGRIVEDGTRDAVFDNPRHDYTKLLLSAVPMLTPSAECGIALRWREHPTPAA